MRVLLKAIPPNLSVRVCCCRRYLPTCLNVCVFVADNTSRPVSMRVRPGPGTIRKSFTGDGYHFLFECGKCMPLSQSSLHFIVAPKFEATWCWISSIIQQDLDSDLCSIFLPSKYIEDDLVSPFIIARLPLSHIVLKCTEASS